MNRKSFALLMAGLTLGVLLGSGLFNEAEQAHLSKTGWVATTAR